MKAAAVRFDRHASFDDDIDPADTPYLHLNVEGPPRLVDKESKHGLLARLASAIDQMLQVPKTLWKLGEDPRNLPWPHEPQVESVVERSERESRLLTAEGLNKRVRKSDSVLAATRDVGQLIPVQLHPAAIGPVQSLEAVVW